LQRKNMMAANYRHIGGLENRLGRHYSRFSASGPRHPSPLNHLPGENRGTAGRIGEVGLMWTGRSDVPTAAGTLRYARWLVDRF
jgi:hypothetical protein